jgi:hypothetical protein
MKAREQASWTEDSARAEAYKDPNAAVVSHPELARLGLVSPSRITLGMNVLNPGINNSGAPFVFDQAPPPIQILASDLGTNNWRFGISCGDRGLRSLLDPTTNHRRGAVHRAGDFRDRLAGFKQLASP